VVRRRLRSLSARIRSPPQLRASPASGLARCRRIGRRTCFRLPWYRGSGRSFVRAIGRWEADARRRLRQRRHDVRSRTTKRARIASAIRARSSDSSPGLPARGHQESQGRESGGHDRVEHLFPLLSGARALRLPPGRGRQGRRGASGPGGGQVRGVPLPAHPITSRVRCWSGRRRMFQAPRVGLSDDRPLLVSAAARANDAQRRTAHGPE
jgi:hypothetical protein